MALQIQYDLFENKEETELNELRKMVRDYKESSDKVRKGLFARHNELAKMYVELHEDVEIIKRNICK